MKKIIIFVFLMMSSSPALAFDCGKASSASEKAICGNRDLVTLDAGMSGNYKRLESSLPADQKSKLRKSQIAWLKNRDSVCGGKADCLLDEINTRNTQLAEGKFEDSMPHSGNNYGTYQIKK